MIEHFTISWEIVDCNENAGQLNNNNGICLRKYY